MDVQAGVFGFAREQAHLVHELLLQVIGEVAKRKTTISLELAVRYVSRESN